MRDLAPPHAHDLREVTEVLDAFIDERIASAPAATSLWAEVRRASAGGKLIRPRLVLAVHRALGGEDLVAERRVAASLELLHTAFLIHDDVIDRDWTRRGRPTVAAAFRQAARSRGRRADTAEHYGTSAAIIAGDLAVAGAIDLAWSATPDPTRARTLARIIGDAVSATAAGELMDVELAAAERGHVDAVLAMYEAKTSVYSFCAPLQSGAVLAGAPHGVVAALGRAGMALGVAFQITDDLLGTFGDSTRTGKSVVSDAREGKQTVLAALLAAADPAAAAAFRRGAGRPRAGVAEAYRDAVERSGARAAAAELARAKTEEAKAHLAHTPAPVREALEVVLDDLRERVV